MDRIAFAQVTDSHIQTAQRIEVIDPQNPSFGHFLWGQNSPGVSVMPGQPAHVTIPLVITISSPDDFQSILKMVKRVKGRLPDDVAHLLTT